jgi:hypothetical protein
MLSITLLVLIGLLAIAIPVADGLGVLEIRDLQQRQARDSGG